MEWGGGRRGKQEEGEGKEREDRETVRKAVKRAAGVMQRAKDREQQREKELQEERRHKMR